MCGKKEPLRQLVLVVGVALPLLAAALVAHARGPLVQVSVTVQAADMVEVNDHNYQQELQVSGGPVFMWFKSPTRVLRTEADRKLVEAARRRYGQKVKFAVVDLNRFEDCAKVAGNFSIVDPEGPLTFCLAYQDKGGFVFKCVHGYGRRPISEQEVLRMFRGLP